MPRMSKERSPIEVTVLIPRDKYAQMLLEKRKAARAERLMPQVESVLISRVESFFQGIDLSVQGMRREGLLDYKITEEEHERRAVASANGIELATLAIWRRSDSEGFENESSRIYTLSGFSGQNRIDLHFSTASTDEVTGEEYGSRLYGRVTRPSTERFMGTIVESPKDILSIAKKLGLSA